MDKLRVLDLFSGIGGFSLGLERTGGFRTVTFCEIEPYCRAVLRKHWPDVPCFEDVRKLTASDVGPIDVICGGFPCQDLSVAGTRVGITGERSGLWSHYWRLIGEIRPRFALVENVPGLLIGERGAWFGRVLGDLAEIGYDAEWHCIPVAAVGGEHIRDRVWIVAYPGEVAGGDAASIEPRTPKTQSRENEIRRKENQNRDIPIMGRKAFMGLHRGNPEPDIPRMADGVPYQLDRNGALGNAVYPAIPEIIGRAILEAEGLK